MKQEIFSILKGSQIRGKSFSHKAFLLKGETALLRFQLYFHATFI